MITKKSKNQQVLFANPFDIHLDSQNRWIKYSRIIPWEQLETYYHQHMTATMGAPSLDARIVLGAIIIKHHEDLSDDGCIEAIQENMYMQYLLGLPSFKTDKVFAPSLFVEIRKRLGLNYWQQINEIIISHHTKKNDNTSNQDNHTSNKIDATSNNENTLTTDIETTPENIVTYETPTPTETPLNEGTLNMDATVIEQDITYPTDLKILNASREKLEQIITTICIKTNQDKPRTYKNVARRDFLNVSKKKNCNAKQIRKGNGKQLSYVKRDLMYISKLLEKYTDLSNILHHSQLRYLQIIHTVYDQQHYMYKNKTHQVADRIVSIHQPQVRPMVRGKAGKNVEFGSKIGVSIHNGLTYLDQLNWNNYNEAEDLTTSAENYKRRNGYYPIKINADQKYITKANREWCKQRNIWLSGKPLGRQSEQSKAQHQALKQSAGERNCVEGKFGQAKRWYINGKIKARLSRTSESMIGAVIVVLNLIRLVQQHVHTILKYYYYLLLLILINKKSKNSAFLNI
jgi:transposase, IS5 family